MDQHQDMIMSAVSAPGSYRGRPFLRWAGSKRQILPILARYWRNSYSRYVEPFAGSASLFFYLSPSRALLSDINVDLIATYCEVQNNLPRVLLSLSKLKRGRRNYLAIRATDSRLLNPHERAARFIYLNRYCYNGLYRTNLAGEFNVPYGGDKSGDLPPRELFQHCYVELQKAELASASFEESLQRVRPGDFVYLDPPFSVKSRRVFSEYYGSSFGTHSLKPLREWLLKLDRQQVSFLVSYAESKEANYLSRGFHTEIVSVKRSIAGFAQNRVSTNELLISNCHI